MQPFTWRQGREDEPASQAKKPTRSPGAVPASLMIFQDGQAFKDMDGVVRAPNVLDNLM